MRVIRKNMRHGLCVNHRWAGTGLVCGIFLRLKRPVITSFALLVLTALLIPTSAVGQPSTDQPLVQTSPSTAYDLLIEKAVEFDKEAYTTGATLGAYDAYVLTLAGQDVSGADWTYNGTSLKDSVLNTVQATLADPSNVSAKEIAYELLALDRWSCTDLTSSLVRVIRERQRIGQTSPDAGQESGGIADPAVGSFDGNVYSDMAAFDALGRAGRIGEIDADAARRYILGTQCATEGENYGSWGGIWEGTYYPDFMTTAQALRALAYMPGAAGDEEIRKAVDAGLTWMRKQQQADGGLGSRGTIPSSTPSKSFTP